MWCRKKEYEKKKLYIKEKKVNETKFEFFISTVLRLLFVCVTSLRNVVDAHSPTVLGHSYTCIII